jgi:glucosamine--fructose-6-phosphate aminotransferase (isomerizing)
MSSLMLTETREAPARVAAMLGADEAAYAALAVSLADRPPPFAATIARGSSDHAATYLAYLLGIAAGIVTASLPPSLVTRYGARPALDGALVVGLSQSGASPDIVAALGAAGAVGGTTVAIVNADASPLAAVADHVLPQHAGAERSVAATKSLICTLAVATRLVGEWLDDKPLLEALEQLPDRLDMALACDWSPAVPLLREATSLYVVGRGPGLAIAAESALKLKEAAGLHAEALSAAEIHHGPRAIIGEGFPLMAYALADPGGDDARSLALELAASGARVAVASHAPVAAPALHLPLPPPLHPLLDPIVAIQAFYPMAAALAEACGHDPDHPRGLKKITATL